MNEQRLADLALWRDAQLFKARADEGAALRLAKGRTLPEALALVDAIDPPNDDELKWTSLQGEPIDPTHHWWSG